MIRLATAALFVAAAAYAGEPDATSPPERAPGRTAVPSNGVEEGPRRGTFAEASLGMLTAMGGNHTFSNAQPYLGLTFGRDLGDAASLFASVGSGASSNSCFQTTPTGECQGTDSFSATFIELGGSYGIAIAPRLRVVAKAALGVTLFSPGPFTDGAGAVPDHLAGPHAGGGIGLDYATHLEHFAVGLDTMLRYSLVSRAASGGKAGIASLAILPHVRYVF
jgi:hypothetical protein